MTKLDSALVIVASAVIFIIGGGMLLSVINPPSYEAGVPVASPYDRI